LVLPPSFLPTGQSPARHHTQLVVGHRTTSPRRAPAQQTNTVQTQANQQPGLHGKPSCSAEIDRGRTVRSRSCIGNARQRLPKTFRVFHRTNALSLPRCKCKTSGPTSGTVRCVRSQLADARHGGFRGNQDFEQVRFGDLSSLFDSP
jgi:hypothetical protein